MIDIPTPEVRAEITNTTELPVVAAEAKANTPTVPVYAPVETTLRVEPSVEAPEVKETVSPLSLSFPFVARRL